MVRESEGTFEFQFWHKEEAHDEDKTREASEHIIPRSPTNGSGDVRREDYERSRDTGLDTGKSLERTGAFVEEVDFLLE